MDLTLVDLLQKTDFDFTGVLVEEEPPREVRDTLVLVPLPQSMFVPGVSHRGERSPLNV